VGEDLAVLQAEFPAFRIWQEQMPGRIRYVARSRDEGVNPHTVITADIDELREALQPALAGGGGTAIRFSAEPNIARCATLSASFRRSPPVRDSPGPSLQRVMTVALDIRLRQILARVRRHDRGVQPDTGHAPQLPVRDPHQRQHAMPGGAPRPGIPPRRVHRSGDLPPPPVPAGGDLAQRPPRRRHRRDRAEQLPLVTHHPEITDHPRPVSDRARQVREQPTPVMTAQRRWQRRRQARRQPGPVSQLPQQRQARVRHHPGAPASDFKTARPSCSVHVESAPRTRSDRDLDNPYRPSSGALLYSGAPLTRQTP